MTSPTTLIVFGVSGDLAGRKLLPALYQLLAAGALPDDFHLIGAARREVTVDGLIATTKRFVGNEADPKVLAKLKGLTHIVRMDSGNPDDYGQLQTALSEIEGEASGATRLLHLSVPPTVAGKIITAFGQAGIAAPPNRTTRLLMEKPFGSDLASAEELDRQLHAVFNEENIYRIDHYVFKETVQNMVAIRQRSPQIEAIWNGDNIQRIEIEASEAIDIEGRADFYEQTGALRDIVQNHLLALMALTMMDLPTESTAASVQAARVALLASVKPISSEAVPRVALRGQYENYTQEVHNPDSHVETFAQLRLAVNAQRWRGVPVILKTGKALATKRSEIRLVLKQEDQSIEEFVQFRLADPEGISLQVAGKRPGLESQIQPIMLNYQVPDDEPNRLPESYERIFSEAMAGDRTNFTSDAEVLVTWKIVEAVVAAWQRDGAGLQLYPKGSAGPQE